MAVLNDWATDPDASHVAVTPDDAELEDLFRDLAANISKPGATDIVIDEVIHPDFIITSLMSPTAGTAAALDAHTLQWKIPELGVSANEGASLEFQVQHIGQTSGEVKINQSIDYSDNEGNVVVFPDPSVTVECGIVITPEPCPVPVNVTMGGCRDALRIDLGDAYLESLGRILQLDVTVKDVCPGKRVALAVILTEVDANGGEHQRGMKAITIPAHNDPSCRDVLVQCIRFVLPEDLQQTERAPFPLNGRLPPLGRVRRGIFEGQPLNGGALVPVLLQNPQGAKQNDTAEIAGVGLGHHLVLVHDAEGDLGTAPEGVQLVAGLGAVKIDPLPVIDIADGQGIGIALVPGQGQHAGGAPKEHRVALRPAHGLPASPHIPKHI